MIKAVIFDMDGLMIDSEKLYFETERQMAQEYNKTIDDTLLWKLMGRSPLEAAQIFLAETGLPYTPRDFISKRDRLMEIKYRNNLETMPGLLECIQSFSSYFKMAIATGSPRKFLDIVVDQLDIRGFFTVLQSSDEIKQGKPHPEIYEKVINKLGLQPDECVVLEDSSNGALAGKNAGCYTIGVYSEYTKEQNFDFVDYYADNLIDARDHILKELFEAPDLLSFKG